MNKFEKLSLCSVIFTCSCLAGAIASHRGWAVIIAMVGVAIAQIGFVAGASK